MRRRRRGFVSLTGILAVATSAALLAPAGALALPASHQAQAAASRSADRAAAKVGRYAPKHFFAFISNPDGYRRQPGLRRGTWLYEVPTRGGPLRALGGRISGDLTNSNLSADSMGNRLAFRSVSEPKQTVFTYRLGESKPNVIRSQKKVSFDTVMVSPDGSRIAYAQRRYDNTDSIWVSRFNGSGYHQVGLGPDLSDEVSILGWSSNSRALYVTSVRDHYQQPVRLVPLSDPAHDRIVYPSTASETATVDLYSDDGKRVLWDGNCDQCKKYYLATANGTSERQASPRFVLPDVPYEDAFWGATPDVITGGGWTNGWVLITNPLSGKRSEIWKSSAPRRFDVTTGSVTAPALHR